MLTVEENELLTRVGPGTAVGELLRRYWMPLAPRAEIDEKGKRQLRLLGEDLLVFKDGGGSYGLVAEQCSHRGVSLFYGRIEADGIRCPYHGWKYDVRGRCIDQPAEPSESHYKNSICHPAYTVEELGGVLFGYLGPAPAPLLPRYDILVRQDWARRIELHPVLDCNWLQPMENAVDPAHLHWLHGFAGGANTSKDERSDFEIFDYGIYKSHHDEKRTEVHPLVFPNILRGPGNVGHFRIPMDDTHTGVLYVIYSPAPPGEASGQSEVPYKFIGPIKENVDDYGMVRPRHHMKTFASQDGMAWETQGAIADRAREHLASSDKGVVMLRQLLRIQLEKIKRGEDPIGVIRDAAKNQMIEFKVQVIDKTTGKEIPYGDYDRRSFATPISEKAKPREGDEP